MEISPNKRFDSLNSVPSLSDNVFIHQPSFNFNIYINQLTAYLQIRPGCHLKHFYLGPIIRKVFILW